MVTLEDSLILECSSEWGVASSEGGVVDVTSRVLCQIELWKYVRGRVRGRGRERG